MSRKPIRFTCRTKTCDNYCLLESDGPLPKDWLCPVCEMRESMMRGRNFAAELFEAFTGQPLRPRES